jgi:GLPGLI family protein
MKFKLILAILCLLQNSYLIAQTKEDKNYGKVTYERILNFDGNPKTTDFSLFFNPDFSIFYEERIEPIEETTLKPSSDNEFDLSFDVKFNGSKYTVLTDFRKDSIQSQVSLFRDGKQKTYVVEEKINNIKWNITQEFKTISGFNAQKAEGLFRGRKYIAWFTNEIPIKYGPWKLNGLPGLILNVSDDKNEVMFYAKSIKVPFNSNSVSNNEFTFSDDYDKISLSEYIKFKKQQVEEVKKLFSSKLPRGARMETTKSKSNDIELEYEETINN